MRKHWHVTWVNEYDLLSYVSQVYDTKREAELPAEAQCEQDRVDDITNHTVGVDSCEGEGFLCKDGWPQH